jgi:hypothetical protein
MLQRGGKGEHMRLRRIVGVAAVAVLVVASGCSATRSAACHCPKPVAYTDATEKQITLALRALPPGNVLHRAMEDYEYERDDLRFCR